MKFFNIESKLQFHNYLPYYQIVEDNIVLTKTGMLFQTLVYNGYSHDINREKEEESHKIMKQALHSFEEGWCLWFDVHRRRSREVNTDDFSSDVAKKFDSLRCDYYNDNPHYRTHKFISIGYQLPEEHLSWIDRMMFQGSFDKNFELTIAKFKEKMTTVLGILVGTALSNASILFGDNLISYLYSCVSTKMQNITADKENTLKKFYCIK